MKKASIVIALLTCSMMASAQITAEEMIALMPTLPTEAEMIRYQREENAPPHLNIALTQPNLFNDFLEALKAAQDKAGERMESTSDAMVEKIMGSQAAGTGLTVSEIAGMSESQLEQLAKEQVANKLGGLGLSMSDIAKLGDGDISEAQAMALARKMMNQKVSTNNNMDRQKQTQMLNQKLRACNEREQELLNEIIGLRQSVLKEGRDLYDHEFKTRVKSYTATMQQAIKEGALSEKYTEAEAPAIKAAEQKYCAASEQAWKTYCDFYAKFIPMWRNMILEAMNLCKTEMLPLMNEKKRLTDSLYAITQDADYAIGETYPPMAVMMYLEQPELIDHYENVLAEEEEEEE